MQFKHSDNFIFIDLLWKPRDGGGGGAVVRTPPPPGISQSYMVP